jgi:hypothetical protein
MMASPPNQKGQHTMTDAAIPTESTLTGRALWDAYRHKHNAYDVVVQDGEAFAYAMFDKIDSNGFSPLTGGLSGGEGRKRYDEKRAALYAYLDAHEVDSELRTLIDALDDVAYDFASQTFKDGVAFATATELFRQRLLGMMNPTAPE